MKFPLIAAAALVLMHASGAAHAQARVGTVPPVAKDLVGARAAGAETALETRGLKFARGETIGMAKVNYWKELGTGGCVAVRTENGKIASALYAPPSKCGSSAPAAAAPPAKSPSSKARSACTARFGQSNFKAFTITSPLKPGYWELQMVGKNGRKASCTVSDAGTIEEWVEL